MWLALGILLRTAIAIAGIFCLLTAVLSYPGEEGRMQSVLEELWTRIDDRQTSVLSLHAAFMQQVAKSTARGLDLLFGHGLFTLRCLGASVCFSISSVALVFLCMLLYPGNWHNLDKSDLLTLAILGCLGPLYLALGTIHLWFRGFRFTKTWLFLVLASACVLWGIGFSAPSLDFWHKLIYVATRGVPSIGACFLCDALFIAATRASLRWAGEMRSSWKIAVLVLLNLLLAAGLVLAPFYWAFETSLGSALDGMMTPGPTPTDSATDIVMSASASNAIDVLAASAFVLLALALLVHRAIWPLLNRSIFRLQEIGTKSRRTILISLGLTLLAAGTGENTWHWVKKIAEMLTG